MEAKKALAFVARRAGASAMEESRWRHVMSLELGWMPPGQAGRYVAACRAAGLLVEEDGVLRLAFDGKGVEVPRGFRPDPEELPAPGGDGLPRSPEAAAAPAAPRGKQSEPADASSPAAGESTPAPEPAGKEPAAQASVGADLFSTWLPKVAAAREEDITATMAAVERQQEAAGGLLHAEPALLRLGAEAGLDVREAAQQALSRLRA